MALTPLQQARVQLNGMLDSLAATKAAFQAMPPMPPPGAPPMDPAMMQGGAPPMDPAAQAGAPPAPGGDPQVMESLQQIVGGLEEMSQRIEALETAQQHIMAGLSEGIDPS
jgi:hypothetical protein